jgi:hypothetical protein
MIYFLSPEIIGLVTVPAPSVCGGLTFPNSLTTGLPSGPMVIEYKGGMSYSNFILAIHL